jgi:hypothetical protein
LKFNPDIAAENQRKYAVAVVAHERYVCFWEKQNNLNVNLKQKQLKCRFKRKTMNHLQRKWKIRNRLSPYEKQSEEKWFFHLNMKEWFKKVWKLQLGFDKLSKKKKLKTLKLDSNQSTIEI